MILDYLLIVYDQVQLSTKETLTPDVLCPHKVPGNTSDGRRLPTRSKGNLHFYPWALTFTLTHITPVIEPK